MGLSYLKGIEFQLCKAKKISGLVAQQCEYDLLNCTLKHGGDSKFCVTCISPQIKVKNIVREKS